MMGWFDKLKELVKIDIKDSFNLNINIKSNNVSKPVEYNEEIRSVSINLERLSHSEKEAVEQILEGAVRDNKVLLEQNSEKLIQDFRSEERSGDTKSLLSYFKDKIPTDDFEALRAGLYLRKLFQAGEGSDVIYRLKGDIIKKHGKRGLNISNLCSAGYFETMIRPLYGEMEKDPDFSKEKFDEAYNIIINEAAFAIFVSGAMSVGMVKTTIQEKIQRNLKYGVKFVNIHGIGKGAVEKIREALLYIEGVYPNINKTIEENEDIIFVKLRFLDR